MKSRLAIGADASALASLINAAYRVEAFFKLGDRISAAEVRAKIDTAGRAFLVLEGSGGRDLIGTVYVELRGDRGYFGLLSVDPGAQGKGLGRVLVEAAESWCRAAGCLALDIDVVNLRTELPPFYAKFGFREVGSAPFPASTQLSQPVHLLLMSKSLR